MVKKLIKKAQTIGIRKTAKMGYDLAIRSFVPGYHERRWNRLSGKPGYCGVTEEKRQVPLVVSLTTYPARIGMIHHVIKTLLTQTVKPDVLVLWLAPEQFPNREQDLPQELLDLREYGLTIDWCKDTRSYKKLIPTLLKYPDAVIITADDDMYYHPKMVEQLYKAYLQDDSCIHCHRVTKFEMENGEYKTRAGGYDIYPHPSFLHKLTGCSGVCYPPHCLHKDITDDSLFMTLAPTNDDIWFWFMGVLANMRCNVVKHSYPALYFVEGSQVDSLSSVNDAGEKLFWKQFHNLLNHYSELDAILKEEWNREKKS